MDRTRSTNQSLARFPSPTEPTTTTTTTNQTEILMFDFFNRRKRIESNRIASLISGELNKTNTPTMKTIGSR